MGTAPGLHEKIADLIRQEKKSRLLDIPAGQGELALRADEMGMDVTAADIDESYFRYPLIKFQKADLNGSLPFKDGSFDIVTCIEGAEHLENIYHLFRELARVLKKNGVLIMSTPNILSVFSRVRFLLTGQFDFFGGYYADESRLYTCHINPVYFPLLKLALKRAGLEIEVITSNRDIVKAGNPFLKLFLRGICFLSRKITFLRIKDKTLAEQITSEAVLRGEILILKCRRR
jgi:SAM-dependent methyltransferase